MIRLIYWLIKRRWAICKECKWTNDAFNCKKYTLQEPDYVKGGKRITNLGLCRAHNTDGCCWGFKSKPKDDYVEPSEPWPRY